MRGLYTSEKIVKYLKRTEYSYSSKKKNLSNYQKIFILLACLGGGKGNGNEWKKNLEYLFSCLSVLIGDNEMSMRKYSFIFVPLKSKNFHSPKNWEEFEIIKLDLINFL